ncbi:hypothetical protein ACFWXA_35205 [Streptomyces atroolivaceus]|uniref:hypothetical protein n=1 Tax=Streptomyces atroolivaceus TaxID=66869 RepID=UPI00364A6697
MTKAVSDTPLIRPKSSPTCSAHPCWPGHACTRTDPADTATPVLLNQQALTTAPGNNARPTATAGFTRRRHNRRQNARLGDINEDCGTIPTATGGTPDPGDEAVAVVRGAKTYRRMNKRHVEDEVAARVSLRGREVTAGTFQRASFVAPKGEPFFVYLFRGIAKVVYRESRP